MRVFIVDDEPPARDLIREYLADFPDITLIGEAGTGKAAVDRINTERPDLVFLDIQMPGLDGFQVLERLDPMPLVVFSTAYDTFAVRAFDVSAVDYLLKPYTRARFRAAMERVTAPSLGSTVHMDRMLELMRQVQHEPEYLERLFVRSGSRIVPVNIEDVLHFEAAGDYVELHTPETVVLTTMRLNALEDRLDPSRFTRIHRSTIIALSALEYLESDGEGGFFATLTDGTTVRVSRTYASRMKDRIQ